MRKRKLLNGIGAAIVVLGVLWLIGTVGALEHDHIGFTQALVQTLIGIGAAVLGGRLFSATYNPYDYEEEEDDHE